MKTLFDIKQMLSTAKRARLRGEARTSALKGIYSDLRTLELKVAMNPGYMDFYEVGEMRKFIHEMQKLLEIA